MIETKNNSEGKGFAISLPYQILGVEAYAHKSGITMFGITILSFTLGFYIKF